MNVRVHPIDIERYRLDGHIVPPPFQATGIIDTAAQKTCIRTSTAERLLLQPLEQGTLSTASGQVKSAVYHLELQFGATLEHPPDPIPVRTYAAPEVLGAELLIGLDVLRLGQLFLFGTENRYELFLPRTSNPSN